MPPRAPTLISFNQNSQSLTFSGPDQNGGSNIQCYELHMKSNQGNSWFLYNRVEVKHLSQEPDIQSKTFGRLMGTHKIRVYGQNLSGLGSPAEINILLTGDLPYFPSTAAEITNERFLLHHSTFYVEYFFFSDHNDAPKVIYTISVWYTSSRHHFGPREPRGETTSLVVNRKFNSIPF